MQEKALGFLQKYLYEYKEQHPFKSFKEQIDRDSSLAENSNVDAALAQLARRLIRYAYDAFFMQQVCSWKVFHIVRALLNATETENPVSLAGNTRALIEHLASYAHVAKSMENLAGGMEGQGSSAKIGEALDRAEVTLKRSYYGTSPHREKPKDEQAHHINDCLIALQEDVEDIGEVYGYLCEYVHPNYGSNQLVANGELGCGDLEPDPGQLTATVDRMCGYAVLTLDLLIELESRSALICLKIKDLSERCLQPRSAIGNVFGKRPLKPAGDGMSQQTAYYFPKARTAMEAITMTYEFLQAEGIEINGAKELGGIEDGWIFDVFPTSRGNLWFKIPQMKL